MTEQSRFPYKLDWILLALLAVFIVATHVVWLRIDTRPQPGIDANVFLLSTLQIVDGIADGQLPAHQVILEESYGGRPPLYQLLAMPFIALLGRSADASLAVNALFLVAILLGTYAIGRLTLDRRAGLLAAFTVATMPPAIGLSRIFLPHFATVAVIAVAVALLQLMLKSRSVASAWLLGITLGLGAWIHPKSLYFLFLPTVAVGLYALFFQLQPRYPNRLRDLGPWFVSKFRDRFIWLGLLPAGIISILIPLPWYILKYSQVMAVQQKGASQYTDITKGFEGVSRSFWWFVRTSPGAISWPYVLLFALALVILILARKELMVTLLAIFVLMYIAIATYPGGFAWFNGSALLPVVAAVIGVAALGLLEIPSLKSSSSPVVRTLSYLMVFAILGTGVFNFVYSSVPVAKNVHTIARRLGSPVGSGTCDRRMNAAFCPNPAQSSSWQGAAIIDTVANDEICQVRTCTLVVQGGLSDALQYEIYTVEHHLDDRVKVVSDAAIRRQISLERFDWLGSEFILYDPDQKGTIRGMLTSQDSPFADKYRTVADYTMPDGGTQRLARRSQPMTQAEEAHIALMSFRWADANNPRLAAAALETANTTIAQLAQDNMDAALEILDSYPSEVYGDEINLLRKDTLLDAITHDPTDPNLRTALADAYQDLGQTADALDQIEIARKLAPDQAAPLVELGNIYYANGQTDAAIAAWQDALSMQPDMPDTCYRVGQALERVDAMQAVQQYADCIDIDKDGEYGRKAGGRATGLISNLIEQASLEEDSKQTLELLEMAVAVVPDDVRWRTKLAKAYREAGQFPAAIAQAEAAVELSPDQASPQVLLGNLFNRSDQLESAISAWQAALNIQPNLPDVCLRLGQGLESIDVQKAAEQYTTCIETDTSGDNVKKAINRRSKLIVAAAEQAFDNKDFEQAVDFLELAVVEWPDDVELRTMLAKSYREVGQLPEAIAQAEAAVELAPKQASALVLLGNLYNRAGRPEDAIPKWQAALAIQPNLPSICFRLGRALEEIGVQQAVDQYSICIETDPDGEYGKKAKDSRNGLLTESSN